MILAFVISTSLSVCFCDIATTAYTVSKGTVRLYRNGVADTNQSWSSGIVQIYYSGQWGNICDDYSFGSEEADVICHQLGYYKASSYSNTGIKTTFGIDASATVMGEVSCGYSSAYLAITQCSFSGPRHISSTCDNSKDVTVSCYSDKLWDYLTPSDGVIRLTGGTYSNQGLLEVYCNGKWGTVCKDYFGATQAQVACRQLGYNYYKRYNHLTQKGTLSHPIFLRSLSGCTSSDNCLTKCGGCPSKARGIKCGGCSSKTRRISRRCSHKRDVTLECSYSSSKSKVYTETLDSCINIVAYNDRSREDNLLVAVIYGILLLCAACICLFVCICACLVSAIKSLATRVSSSYKPQCNNDTADTVAMVQQSSCDPVLFWCSLFNLVLVLVIVKWANCLLA